MRMRLETNLAEKQLPILENTGANRSQVSSLGQTRFFRHKSVTRKTNHSTSA